MLDQNIIVKLQYFHIKKLGKKLKEAPHRNTVSKFEG